MTLLKKQGIPPLNKYVHNFRHIVGNGSRTGTQKHTVIGNCLWLDGGHLILLTSIWGCSSASCNSLR